MMAAAAPSRRLRWERVNPFKVMNRDGGGTMVEVTGKPFQWAGNSYRRASVQFTKPIDRFVINFTFGGTAWPHACSMSGLCIEDDFKDMGPIARFDVPKKAGTVTLNSGAPGNGAWLNFLDVYGEVFS